MPRRDGRWCLGIGIAGNRIPRARQQGAGQDQEDNGYRAQNAKQSVGLRSGEREKPQHRPSEKWQGEGSDYDYDYMTKISDELLDQKIIKAKVHSIANAGSVLVIEFGDIVMPVFNSHPELANGLYRNDKIELKFKA